MDFSWNEFLYGGHWGSLAASAIVLSTCVIAGIVPSFEFLLIAYLGTQAIYIYNHTKEINSDELTNLPRTNHLHRYFKKYSLLVSIYTILYISLLVYFGTKISIYFGGSLLVAGLFFTYKGKMFSKKVSGFKTFYVAFSWSLLPIFTALYYNLSLTLGIILFSIFVFIKIFIDVSYFDLKDLNSDASRKLSTIPMLFQSKRNFLNFLHILNILSLIPLIIGIFLKIFPHYTLMLVFTAIYCGFYIQKGKNEHKDILSISYIIVDGEYYYWPFLLFIGMYIL